MHIQPTYELAMATGRDAANARMTKQGRTKWNRADYNMASRIVEELMQGVTEIPASARDSWVPH